MSVPSKKLEWFHASRAFGWFVFAIYVFTANPGLAKSVPLVIGLSLYANFGTDVSSWQGARAERRSLENPRPEP